MPKVPGVDHRFVPAGDLTLHLAVAGEGEPVLLVHGWPEHWYAWRDVIVPLAESREVIAADLRGFGWSEIAWQGLDVRTMAGDLARVIADLEHDRVPIVAHDFGAAVAFELAARHPELVERLVVVGAAPPWAPRSASMPALRRIARRLLAASPPGYALLNRGIGLPSREVRAEVMAPERLDPDALALYVRDLEASTRARAGRLLNRSLLADELNARPHRAWRDRRLEVPTLILLGDRDRLVEPDAYADAERFAGDLRTETLPGAGHYLPEEAPEVVAERILAFLAGDHEPAAAGVE